MTNALIGSMSSLQPASRVLIVDDAKSVLQVLARWLTDEGYDVVTCQSYEDARQFLLREQPAIMVADVRLGAFNGLQLAMVLRDRNPGAQIIVLSGFDDPTIREQAHAIGATFFVKPFSREELLAVMKAPDRVRH